MTSVWDHQRAEAPYLTLAEAATLLGVSRPTVARLVERGAVPFRPVGARRLLDRADLSRLAQRLPRARR